MTSTRMIYDKASFCEYVKQSRSPFLYETMKLKCVSNSTAFPCLGLNMPTMINGYNNKILSNNAPDIESALFGIGNHNKKIMKKSTISPEINNIPYASFFKLPDTILPEPLYLEKSQRPRGPFC
jgi:hypothetical protein